MRRFILILAILALGGCGGNDSGPKGSEPNPVDDKTKMPSSGEMDRIYGRLGVIAYSRETGKVGIITNTGSLTEVARQAVAECGQPDCKAVVWVERNCAVLAISKNDRHHGAAAYYGSAAGAATLAVGQCTKKYGDCEAIAYVCS